jgi:hypothetical protein
MGRPLKWPLVAAAVLGLAAIGLNDAAGQLIHPPKKAEVKADANNDDAVVRQVEQQYGAQIRQVHRTEMHLMRIVAEPTKEQYEKIAADGVTAMKAAAKKYADAMNGNGFIGDEFDPRKSIAEVIAQSVRSTLSPEQFARYEKELKLRTAARKRMVVSNLVSMVDGILILRPDQREKIREILNDNWNEIWDQPQLYMYGRQYIPPMPDAKINPILTDTQRTVWQGVQKMNVRFGMNGRNARAINIPDEAWDNNPQRKNPAPPSDKAAPQKEQAPKAGGKP